MSYTVDTEAASLFLSLASKIQELEVLDHKKLTLVLKYERPTVEQTLSCDKLLSSISLHKNLRKVVVKGMSVSMGGLNSLSKTNFFSNLVELNVSIEKQANESFEMTANAISTVGKMKNLGLLGVETVESLLVRKMVVRCRKFQKLETDCHLAQSDVVAIHTELQMTLTELDLVKRRLKRTDQLVASQSLCKNLKRLNTISTPLFLSELKHYPNLVHISLDLSKDFNLDLFQSTFLPGAFPTVDSLIDIETNDFESEIFSAIPKACPNLTRLCTRSTSTKFNIRIYQKLISELQDLERISINIKETNTDCRISDIFNQSDVIPPKLEVILSNFGTHPKEDAKRLFKQIPHMMLVGFNNRAYVQKDKPIKKVSGVNGCFEKVFIV
jgi:hypothetical protein